jgi:hypothetical protein
MSRAGPEEPRFRTDQKRRWLQAAVVLVGLALITVVGLIIRNKVEEDTSRRAGTKVVRGGIPCELTGEATPVSHGAGFVLIGQCPGGTARVQPTLSLWMQLIEALPTEKRVVVVNVGFAATAAIRTAEKRTSSPAVMKR